MKLAWHSFILLFVLLLLDLPATAAPVVAPPPPAPEAVASAATGPTIEQVQARLGTLATAPDLPDSERQQVQELYQQALGYLKAAKSYTDNIAYYQQMQQTAAAETARLQATLSHDPPPAPSPTLSLDSLAKQLTQTQASLNDAQKRLADLDQQLAVQQSRPKNILTEIDGLKQQAVALENKLQASSSATINPLLAEARLVALGTQRQTLNRQITMLEQERLSYDVRLAFLNTQRAAAAQEVEHAQALTLQLQNLLNTRRRAETAAVVQQTTQATEEAAAKPEVVQAVAAENARVSHQLAMLVQQSDEVSASQTQVNERLARLTERMRGIKQQLGIVGFSDAIGPILLAERRNLPDVRQYRRNADQRQQRIVQARLEQYQAEEALRQARAVQDNLQTKMATFDPQWSAAQRQELSTELRSLLTDRQELLEKLGSGYANLITQLVALDDSQRKLGEQAEQYGMLLDKYLLWIRSSPPLNAEWVQGLRTTLNWLVNPKDWESLRENLVESVRDQWAWVVVGLLSFLGLLYYRRALIRYLGADADVIGDVRRDRFMLTLRALSVTLLLALPWPGLIGFFGWLLSRASGDTEFARAQGQGLFAGALMALTVTFWRQFCRPRGVAILHFGWDEAGCRLLRRHLNWFLWVGPPSTVIVRLCNVQPEILYGDTLGRLLFCVGSLGLAALFWRVLNPHKALLSSLAVRHSGKAWRLHYFWYPLMIGLPLVMAGLALGGYYYTALQLHARLILMIVLLLTAVILINLFLRWLNVSQRRLAWRHARAKREAQIAARATKDATPVSGEGLPEIQSLPDLDLNTISEQTRSLIRFAVLIGLWFGLWQIWGGLIPAFTILNDITLWHQMVQTAAGAQIADITLGSLVGAVALLLLVGFLAHNLPGVLELTVLQQLNVEPGNRSAIITISRYLITGVGLLTALDIIGFSWSQVQWLVAALGVGLGFGMQEIFGNFVSGIILLFERPIRVGDTVTLGELSGTVSRINIRATTITDWDRKEIIVPNKTFITNSLINWTRNDPITRIVIPVGVGYDSDTAQVHAVLLAVATSHPLVLKEPSPAALFLKFGESALEFEVRVFVRELANRLPLTHELHNDILQALRENGIEIPFPQRELRWRDPPAAEMRDGLRKEPRLSPLSSRI